MEIWTTFMTAELASAEKSTTGFLLRSSFPSKALLIYWLQPIIYQSGDRMKPTYEICRTRKKKKEIEKNRLLLRVYLLHHLRR